LTIKGFDIDGKLINKLGWSGVKNVINQFGKSQGVKEVVIERAKRTTGLVQGKYLQF
jgi:hypothetical protein